MILDERTEFCDATALDTNYAADTTRYLIGDQIDLGAASEDLATPLDELYLVITVDTAPTSANSTATATFFLASDAAAAMTPASASIHMATKAFTIAEMTAGAVLFVGRLPYSEVERYERYLGILQATGTQAFATGKINAFLTPTPPIWKALPDSIPANPT